MSASGLRSWRVSLDSCTNALDYYHCAEHVHATAHAQFGEGTLEAHEWTEAVLTRLALNELGRTLGGLKRMHPRSPAAAEAIRTLAGYLAAKPSALATTNSVAAGYLEEAAGSSPRTS